MRCGEQGEQDVDRLTSRGFFHFERFLIQHALHGPQEPQHLVGRAAACRVGRSDGNAPFRNHRPDGFNGIALDFTPPNPAQRLHGSHCSFVHTAALLDPAARRRHKRSRLPYSLRIFSTSTPWPGRSIPPALATRSSDRLARFSRPTGAHFEQFLLCYGDTLSSKSRGRICRSSHLLRHLSESLCSPPDHFMVAGNSL